jgi:hypothetical protein
VKTHLAESSQPLREGNTVKALCGKPILNIVFMFRWAWGEFELKSASTLLLCEDCTLALRHTQFTPEHKTYVYGVANREELKGKKWSKSEVLEESA